MSINLFPIVLALAAAEPPTITIDHDNIAITQSCTVKFIDQPILDIDNNGVIQITADNITIDFANQNLRGSKPDQLPDTFTGIGIKITGKKVTLKNATISGFKVGIHALKTDDLTIANCDVSGNFQQHLKSTPQAEDASDWLWPHANDNHEWMSNYGAGICIEDCKNVTLHDITARHGQNGIILDRVNDSKIYDSDCSFLSGWGLSMWRSNRNVISRNAFDFCVRGYSHGVYNRGQDSAGILMFEQCCENVITENSATHCGDGFFGFAGKEALGEINSHADMDWYRYRGCNDNQFSYNDFSHAVAHGLELTFSFRNRIQFNRFLGNGICGIWAGYSGLTEIVENEFVINGDVAYGLERGGINIEHGCFNSINGNCFLANTCGVRLWSDTDAAIMQLPWAKVNAIDSRNNSIYGNRFQRDQLAVQLQSCGQTKIANNSFIEIGREIDADQTSQTKIVDRATAFTPPAEHRSPLPLRRDKHPVGARSHLTGREHIIMTEWGPYDWESPYLQRIDTNPNLHTYRLLGPKIQLDERAIELEGEADAFVKDDRITIKPRQNGTVTPYSMALEVNGTRLTRGGVLLDNKWQITFFASDVDPRTDINAWHTDAEKNPIANTAPSLNLPYRNGGPSDLHIHPRVTAATLPKDHFGTIATTNITFPAGSWRLKTTSDDGIRVWCNDTLAIDDWTWHGPTEHSYDLKVDRETIITIRVEHFELDGYAMLTLAIDQPQP